ncbi:MAG: fumarylacetoacetate hydrolase family protein [Paracoccaceae bacterium]
MKLATRPFGPPREGRHRDGQLLVVSEDLSTCRPVDGLVFQDVVDLSAPEEDILKHAAEPEPFDPAAALAPLPRAYQFLDGSAYVNHVELVRQARGAAMPETFWSDPLMYQGGSDGFLAPTQDIIGHPDWGIDFEAEIAVITRDVPMGISPKAAAEKVAFVMLLNDVSLRNLIPAELSKGFGFVQSKPACACAPVAVAPSSLPGWDGRKLGGILNVDLNGEPFGRANAGLDMTFDFGQLIAHAAKTRSLAAGTIIGSGTVSNKGAGGPGKPVDQGGAGYSCIAEQRVVETILTGAPKTRFLHPGDRVRIWMEDDNGASIFGSIEQTVTHIEEMK